MEKKELKEENKSLSSHSEEDSFEYDGYVIGNDFDVTKEK